MAKQVYNRNLGKKKLAEMILKQRRSSGLVKKEKEIKRTFGPGLKPIERPGYRKKRRKVTPQEVKEAFLRRKEGSLLI